MWVVRLDRQEKCAFNCNCNVLVDDVGYGDGVSDDGNDDEDWNNNDGNELPGAHGI